MSTLGKKLLRCGPLPLPLEVVVVVCEVTLFVCDVVKQVRAEREKGGKWKR